MISIHRILCPIDLSDSNLRPLERAGALARWYEAALTAFFVDTARDIDASFFAALNPAGVATATVEGTRQARLLRQMRAVVDRASLPAGVVVEVEEATDAHRAIVAQATAMSADLIVMGSHGRLGFQGALLGSVAERVLRAATCPVMVVPPHDVVSPATVSFTHIVCAIDFSTSSLAAVRWALSLAEEGDARLSLLHVHEVPTALQIPPVDPGENIEALDAQVRADILTRLRALVPEAAGSYCSIETAIADGAAGRGILNFAADRAADLIVMGAQGHSTLERFVFGSKTHDVVSRARCPVLTVR
jgi:nucleotide-binding universal stress UspA family protein